MAMGTIPVIHADYHCAMRFEDGDDDDGDASNDLERPRKIQRPTLLGEEVEAYAPLAFVPQSERYYSAGGLRP